jgi:hypothetical protein
MATGAIAYDHVVARDPAVVTAIDTIMHAHPDWPRFETALTGLQGANRERRLFELIARWPDDIRGTPYDHEHWHHQLRVVAGWTLFSAIRAGEADHAFATNLRTAGNPDAEASRRAIALCWLFHVLGDMHQPLHAGHKMNGDFPLTDRAGTIAWVRSSADAPPQTLHQFWDMAADLTGDEASAVDRIAGAAEPFAEGPESAKQPPLQLYHHWVRESEGIAANIAYGKGAPKASPRKETAPVISAEFAGTARSVSLQRLGQAGGRLADLLISIFAGSDNAEAAQVSRR